MKKLWVISILLVVFFSLISANESLVSSQDLEDKGPQGCFRERESLFSLFKDYLEHKETKSSEASQAFDKTMKAERKYFNCMRYYGVSGWEADEIIKELMANAEEQRK